MSPSQVCRNVGVTDLDDFTVASHCDSSHSSSDFLDSMNMLNSCIGMIITVSPVSHFMEEGRGRGLMSQSDL